MDLYLSGCLYMIGSLFMTLNFEPEEGASKVMYLLFVFAWPVMTLWRVIEDMFHKE